MRMARSYFGSTTITTPARPRCGLRMKCRTSGSNFILRILRWRQDAYRSLAAAANHFARESHMDGLGHELKMDPLELRMKNLKNERLRGVFQAAAEKFGWDKVKNTPGRGFGMGGGVEKGGYV